MWIWILAFLISGASWGLWYVLRPTPTQPETIFPLLYPLAITAGCILAVVLVLVWRRIRAARAARALERAIAQQAQEQALAKPERRAEIQALHAQLQQGIDALKKSKLGSGRRGEQALYELPWYAIVGPSGSGKTTALRHSGLPFPYLDPEGGGVGGVGGTRNCDWWFTNSGILLDTAGRYATQSEDHDEWVAFLEQLQKYRPHKPLNGVLVAVSVPELLDATDAQIRDMGEKIRARIDEMQSTLKETLPAYVLFTKTDLVSGFVETFGDLKKSERGQPWGATWQLGKDKSNPGKLFEAEFETLVQQLHRRVYKRITGERNASARERVYQFPLEFASLKQNLGAFLQAAFSPAAGSNPVPLLRGFYFTSGTQEGTPLDRVVGAMGKAFGLRPAAPEAAPKGEPKSYFLRDVFEKIVFPDQDIAARSEAEIQRERMQRMLVAGCALALAVLLLVPAIVSYRNNQKLVAATQQASQRAGALEWKRHDAESVAELDGLRGQLETIQTLSRSTPTEYGWSMYQGERVYPPARDAYIRSLDKGFLTRVRARLEEKLKQIPPADRKNFGPNRDLLKTYLLLSQEGQPHLSDPTLYMGQDGKPITQAEWVVTKLVEHWKAGFDGPIEPEQLRRHVAFYVGLLQSGETPGFSVEGPEEKSIVGNARNNLSKIESRRELYEQVVLSLNEEKRDPAGGLERSNLVYPPISLNDIFTSEWVKLGYLKSKSEGLPPTGEDSSPGVVPGSYTRDGYIKVMSTIADRFSIYSQEQWVLKSVTWDGEKELERLKSDYVTKYRDEWKAFFADIDVKTPNSNRDAIDEFKVLATPVWPYLRLLRVLADNTQFTKDDKNAIAEAASADGGVIDQIKKRAELKLNTKLTSAAGTNVNAKALLGEPKSAQEEHPITAVFRSMVEFGVPPEPPKPKANPEGEVAPPPEPKPTSLSKYIGLLEGLAAEMQILEEGPPSASSKKARELFENAVKEAEGLLLRLDRVGAQLMEPLLMNPLRQSYKQFVRSAGGAASGLWEVEVWPHYRDKIKDRYPFNLAATRDASFEDAVAFFKPKDGILWGFYEAHLKEYHTQQEHQFFPVAHLQGKEKKAKPSSPFKAMLYPCLERSHEISDALFLGMKSDKPSVTFQVNLKTVSPIVSEVIFEIDGQKRLYRNEKPFFYEFKWPGDKQTGARIQLRGAGGLDEEILREGPWGIFRLFEVAQQITAEKEKDELFTVTWQMAAPPVTVTMEVRPTRANHPFPLSFFRTTNCPPTIGDAFGK
jgi:type VI secretion system protein ImpL